MTIYDLKPKFQQLLQPIVIKFYKMGFTPNHITLLALILSFIVGFFIFFTNGASWILFILPLFLFIRMALNAIDGILAKKYKMQSDVGAILNEMGDILSDIALYLPFAVIEGVDSVLIVFIVLLAIITETIGILSWAVKGVRRYDGPMGKSDRAFVFGFIPLFLAFGISTKIWLDIMLYLIFALSLLTMLIDGKRL